MFKDVSFWLPAEGGGGDGGPGFHENDLFEQIRAVGGDMVEAVEKIDEFIHPKTQRKSQAYRITWRHMSRTLTDAEVDKMQFEVRDRIGPMVKLYPNEEFSTSIIIIFDVDSKCAHSRFRIRDQRILSRDDFHRILKFLRTSTS